MRLSAPIAAILALMVAHPSARASSAPPAPAAVELREMWIPMRDGVRLSATLHFPAVKKGAAEKFAALLEYLPYRKDESKNFSSAHDYFARHGFLSVQVDIRGTGRSEGKLPEREYSRQEQDDGLQVIAWLARQPWCNGNVGMFGISWGGFNSIQMAMRNPPALKAVIAIDATEDLFHDDVHFIDGMMHIDEYELNVDLTMAVTRSPDFPTDEASLAARFDRPPWIMIYKQHPQAGSFWDEPERALSAIKVPVFMIGGMLDGYRDSIPRMLEGIKAPAKALLGPWNHTEPHEAVPGPAIEWRDQAVEWWDQWLRGRSNGVMQGPKLAVYMNHWYPPDLQIKEIPGEWRAEEGWPPRGQHLQTYYLTGERGLVLQQPTVTRQELAYRPASTQEGGGPDFWWGDVYGDQRSVDAYSLVYDSMPLSDPVTILGRPRSCLRVAATAPTADWFVRLSDVAPDGVTTLVAAAGMAGAQRESMRTPTPLTPSQVYDLCLDLHLTSWVFPAGHRLHVAVSNSMWPMIWPTPYAMTTTLELGGERGSRIELPVVPAHNDLPALLFKAPELPATATAGSQPGQMNLSSDVPGLDWIAGRSPAKQQGLVEWRGGSTDEYPWGSEQVQEHLIFTANDVHPEMSSVQGDAAMTVRLKNRLLEWRTVVEAHSDLNNFYLTVTRDLSENGRAIRNRRWQSTIPRNGQ